MAPISAQTENYRAVVCGTSLTRDSEFRSALTRTGLLHLIVVSGSHLLLLEAGCHRLLRRLPRLQPIIWPVLAAFVLMNRCEPPVFRAFLSLVLKSASRFFQLRWSSVQVVSMAGIAALFVCVKENSLRSLIMSWTASLALSGLIQEDESGKRDGNRFSNTRVYFLLLPALLPVSLPHPISIGFNAVFGPVLGALLFPLSIAAFVAPPIVPMTDEAWHLFQSLLAESSALVPDGLRKCEVPLWALALYLGALTLLFLRLERRRLE